MICNHNCKTYEQHLQKLQQDKQTQLDCLAAWLLDRFNNKEERRAWLARATKRIRAAQGDEAAENYHADIVERIWRIHKNRKGVAA